MLRRYLENRNQSAFARELGLTQAAIAAWLLGTARPEPHYREALERIALIPREAWYSASELAIARGDKVGRTASD